MHMYRALLSLLHLISAYGPPYNCPPYNCPPQGDADCVPNEKASDALSDIEIYLNNQITNLTSASKTAVDNSIASLNSTLGSLNTKNSGDKKTLINKLETDILSILDLRLTGLKNTLDKSVATEFDKFETTVNNALVTAKAQMFGTVDAVSKLTAAEAAAIVKDTQFGLQNAIYEDLSKLYADTLAAGTTAESAILVKLHQSTANELSALRAANIKLFKEFYKALRGLDAKYATDLKKDVDSARNKLEADLNAAFASLIQRETFYVTSTAKKIVEYLTGCAQTGGVGLDFLAINQIGAY